MWTLCSFSVSLVLTHPVGFLSHKRRLMLKCLWLGFFFTSPGIFPPFPTKINAFVNHIKGKNKTADITCRCQVYEPLSGAARLKGWFHPTYLGEQNEDRNRVRQSGSTNQKRDVERGIKPPSAERESGDMPSGRSWRRQLCLVWYF